MTPDLAKAFAKRLYKWGVLIQGSNARPTCAWPGCTANYCLNAATSRCAPGADVSAMISVISNRGCVGFVIRRRHEFEGFDRDQKTLGLFDSEHDAIDAILRHSENQETT